jgi:hypothetical protein
MMSLWLQTWLPVETDLLQHGIPAFRKESREDGPTSVLRRDHSIGIRG